VRVPPAMSLRSTSHLRDHGPPESEVPSSSVRLTARSAWIPSAERNPVSRGGVAALRLHRHTTLSSSWRDDADIDEVLQTPGQSHASCMMALRRNAIAQLSDLEHRLEAEAADANRQIRRQRSDPHGGRCSAMTNEVPQHAGLCATCAHVRVVTTPRSRFVLCERSRTSADFPRYPRLPVLACRGHERAAAAESGADDGADGAS